MRDEQEAFWAGKFGLEYMARNSRDPVTLSVYLRNNCRIVGRMDRRPEKILEFGCNIGINLIALSLLFPEATIDGVEINSEAAQVAQKNIGDRGHIYESSIFDFNGIGYDYVFTSGVLIHINPAMLPAAYKKLHEASDRYISISEYYNPTPVEIAYHGHDNKLFKRDFAKEFKNLYPATELVDYGFFYHNDPVFPLDDLTWFLMKK